MCDFRRTLVSNATATARRTNLLPMQEDTFLRVCAIYSIYGCDAIYILFYTQTHTHHVKHPEYPKCLLNAT